MEKLLSARERTLENWRRERKKSAGEKLHNYWQQGENEEEEEEEDEDEDEEEFLEGSQS
jgi:hypothetical protein